MISYIIIAAIILATEKEKAMALSKQETTNLGEQEASLKRLNALLFLIHLTILSMRIKRSPLVPKLMS